MTAYVWLNDDDCVAAAALSDAALARLCAQASVALREMRPSAAADIVNYYHRAEAQAAVSPTYMSRQLGSLLFLVEVAVIMLWVAFSIYQLVQPAVAVMETENFVLFSIYPFYTTPASIVSVLQELGKVCTSTQCERPSPKYGWFMVPLLSFPVQAIAFAAGFKFFKERRTANLVLGWNACTTGLTALWIVSVYLRMKAKLGSQSQQKRVDPPPPPANAGALGARQHAAYGELTQRTLAV
jgi:hypothetical protein